LLNLNVGENEMAALLVVVGEAASVADIHHRAYVPFVLVARPGSLGSGTVSLELGLGFGTVACFVVCAVA